MSMCRVFFVCVCVCVCVCCWKRVFAMTSAFFWLNSISLCPASFSSPRPNFLGCEVKWVLGSISMNKAGGGDGIPVEVFQILTDYAVNVINSICQQIWKTQQWPQDWQRSIFIPIPKKSNAKECSNYHTIALISHASEVMLIIIQVGLQQYVKHELPDVQAGLRNDRETRDQIANIC